MAIGALTFFTWLWFVLGVRRRRTLRPVSSSEALDNG
jgi:hypothetical protein